MNSSPLHSSPPSPSSYIDYLPGVLQDDAFLGQFLLAFEAILNGSNNLENASPGFEHTLDRIHTFFSPKQLPAAHEQEFLPWLASWVALSLREDWESPVKKDFIQRIVPLYRQRGTPAALKKLLQIYLQKQVEPEEESATEYVEIFEFDHLPRYFQVQLRMDSQNLTEYRRKETTARAIIDLEKPAHTVYALQILMPTMRLVSADKLEAEGVSADEISKRQLRLFGGSQSSGFATHENFTILGNTTRRSLPAPISDATDTSADAAAPSTDPG